MPSILESLRNQVVPAWHKQGLMDDPVSVTAGPLSVEQAIGNPGRSDFPIQKGKEKLMEACFRHARGQAFTDSYGTFSGTLAQVAALPLDGNFQRAVFVSVLNAVLRWQQCVTNTVHCKDCGPKDCARNLPAHIIRRYGRCRVTLAGMQPAMIESLAGVLPLRVVDLDPDNIGQERRGVGIEGADTAQDALAWADLLLVTGTTLANNSIGDFLQHTPQKPVLFYGTTIAGAAQLMGWQRYCPRSS
jgi:hypothetical protein